MDKLSEFLTQGLHIYPVLSEVLQGSVCFQVWDVESLVVETVWELKEENIRLIQDWGF